MIRSMTGFGRGEAAGEYGRLVVEIKSVNHRFSEVVFRMPRAFMALEEQARKLILAQVNRGRVEVFLTWEPSQAGKGVKVDKELALAYHNALKALGEEIGSNHAISLDQLARLPDVLRVEEGSLEPESLWPILESAVLEALTRLIQMREREGEGLKADLTARLQRLAELTRQVAERNPLVVTEYKARLEKRLEELLPKNAVVDPTRLAQEVALFADRADISEEMQRLGAHIQAFHKDLAVDEPVGRRLDFLVQEMGREVNTTGSKGNDALIANLVVAAKTELEKIREQVQNIE
ncbi:MAG TPA: YicC/YloC family endoribonuclease [Symbiobacteriaceae bacterium]|nr:YicC/YloC family endoribonuclease [Symbiobacteriaceae bacterium]